MERRNILITVSFDGSGYRGWQKQPDQPSVQGQIQKAVETVTGEKTWIAGIGRTDAGAHAFRYNANFNLPPGITIPAENLAPALNNLLPADIRVLGAREVPHSFHARFSAQAREYAYVCIRSLNPHPILRNFSHLFTDAPDLETLRKACSLFRGRHDFRNFSYGYEATKDLNREIIRFRVKRVPVAGSGWESLAGYNADFYIFFIKGNGFLKGMIRSIISACLRSSRGGIPLSYLEDAVENRLRMDTKFRDPVPASGLYFRRGFYPASCFSG